MARPKKIVEKNEESHSSVNDFIRSSLKSISNEYASIASDGILGDHSGHIDTGSYLFNALVSGSIYLGLPDNKITTLAGKQATGKSFFALFAAKQFLIDNPNSVVFCFETEGALSTTILEERGIDTSRFCVIPVETIEGFKTQALKLIDKYRTDYADREDKPRVMFVLDSLGMLSTEKEMDDSLEGKSTRDMTRSQGVKSAFRTLSLVLAKVQIPLIVTNHVYDPLDQYKPSMMSGGSGAYYASSIIVFFGKRKEKDGNDVVGNILTCTLNKSRMTRENAKCETLLRYDTGLSRYHGLAPFAAAAGVWKKLSKQYEIDGKKYYETAIDADPEKFYTKEVLDAIDVCCKEYFSYGSSIIVEEEEVE